MKIYLVCSVVDLGYRAQYAYTSYEAAVAKLDELNFNSKQEYIDSCLSNASKFGSIYSYDEIVEKSETYAQQWEIDDVELIHRFNLLRMT